MFYFVSIQELLKPEDTLVICFRGSYIVFHIMAGLLLMLFEKQKSVGADT